MATEKYANNAATTLSGNINSSVTDITPASAAAFPTSGQFRFLIGTEIIIAGSVSGGVFHGCTRGAENTTAASHTGGDVLTFIETAGSIVRNPRSMSATGDIEYLDSTGAPARLAAPADGNYAVTFASGVPSWISQASLSGVPTGVMFMWGTNAAPSGYVLCDGSAISRTTFAALFAIIGTTFGIGDGATTFNVPDFRQRFPLGKAASGTGNALAGTGGNIDHNHTNPSTAASGILDTVSGASDSANVGLSGQFSGSDVHVNGRASPNGYTDPSIQSGSGVGAASHIHTQGNTGNANPPYLVINYIIKT